MDLQVYDGARIGVFGPNGAGKTSLMKALIGAVPELRVGYLRQDLTWNAASTVWEAAGGALLDDLSRLEAIDPEDPIYAPLLEKLVESDAFNLPHRLEELLSRYDLLCYRECPVSQLSGGERMRLGWVRMLAEDPDLLILDEPTNHLDEPHRARLMQLLEEWQGAALVVSHDVDFLSAWPRLLWYVAEGQVTTFAGSYAAWQQEQATAREREHAEWEALLRKRRKLGLSVQQEETRRVRTGKQGVKKYGGDKMMRNDERERAENTMGSHHKLKVHQERENVKEEIQKRRKPRLPTPRFHFDVPLDRNRAYVEVRDGAVGYGTNTLVHGIQLALRPGDRIAVLGPNGSGKTTLLRALLSDGGVSRCGEWIVPDAERIGLLDQHYAVLDRELTVYESLQKRRPDWIAEEIRRHLGAFLFVHHDAHDQRVAVLSEGEKARLALALLAARSPTLLILDEVTNNLDLPTKEHLLEVLRAYPGALLVISHEESFLEQLGADLSVQHQVGSGAVRLCAFTAT